MILRENFLWSPNGTIIAAVILNKNSSEHIKEKGDGPYLGFGNKCTYCDEIEINECGRLSMKSSSWQNAAFFITITK